MHAYTIGKFRRALSQNVIHFSVGEMVLLDPIAVDEAYMKFQNGLNDLTYEHGTMQISKACLICDELLKWNDMGVIQTTRLKSLQSRFPGRRSCLPIKRGDNHEIILHVSGTRM
jgi:hypothetical protein